MAEPLDLDTEDLHPCRNCAGPRVFAQYSWRDPQFWVTCRGCSTSAGGETAAEAHAAWQEANPERELLTEDQYAVEAALLQPQLTAAVLRTLHQAQTLYSASGQAADTASFVAWCQTLAGAEGSAHAAAV